MKKIKLLLLLCLLVSSGSLWAQTAYNPFTQNIHFEPEPSVAGFECGSTPNVEFTAGMTTADSATDWQNNPLKIKVCLTGFSFDGITAAAVVSGSYASNFNWTFDPLNANCIIGTQNQTIYGTGMNPLFPDPRSSGDINLALEVPSTSPLGTILSVDVTMMVPTYMALFNSAPDDAESTQTQTFCTLQITGNVFYDTVLNPASIDMTNPIGDPGGSAIYASLVDSSGNVIDTTQIAADGTYMFDNISPSTTYEIVLSTTNGTIGNLPPTPTLPFGWSNTAEDCCDATGTDGNTNGQVTVVVGLSQVDNANFGITQLVSIGNSVWNDINQNGTRDPGEAGIPGATVNLYEDANMDGVPDGAAIQTTTTTGTDGLYLFDGLHPGSYIVGVTPPAPVLGPAYLSTTGAGEETSPNTDGDNNDNGITLVGGETRSGFITLAPGTEPTGETPSNDATKPDSNSNLTVDFGFYQPLTIAGNVYNDQNGPTNVDGTPINNPSNTPVYASLVDSAGNVVGVDTVNPNGTYEFTDVEPNTTYTVVLSTTPGVVNSPAPTPNLPFGWENVGEDCCDNIGNDGTPDGVVTVVLGTTDLSDANFGIREPLSIGNSVWNDINQNGTRDPGEAGIPGATVNLYEDANMDGVPDGAAIQTTTTTGTDGLYLFDGLNPGSYIVGVTPPAPTSGPAYLSTTGAGEETSPNTDGDNNDNGITLVGSETRSGFVTLAPGTEPTSETPNNDATKPDSNSNLTVDFGFYQPLTIAGNVYNDQNGPTNVDGTPINNPGNTPVYASLVDSAGNVVGVDTVNPNGTYEFTDVEPNSTYTVVLSTTPGVVNSPAPTPSLPFGWENVGEDCCDNIGNDGTPDGVVTVVLGTTDLSDANFGIKEPLSIGNSVWNDINQNGTRDLGEAGIPGATVNLYEDANMDGVPDGAAIQTTTTTGTDGLYLFDGLNPGSYIVGVTPPAPTSGPAYLSTTGAGEETSPNTDGDNNDNGITLVGSETRSDFVTLAPGTEPTSETPNNDATKPDSNSNLTVDFGFYQPLTIAGNVYNDQNGPTNVDGTPINNPGNTPVYASLVDSAGNVVGVDTVNPNGTYEFTDVEPNTTYTVVLSTTPGVVNSPAPTPSLPFGWENVGEDCCDNVGNDGTPDGVVTVVLGTTDLSDANFGIKEPLSIGNSVWNDINQNGTRDLGEAGIPGATVNLYEDANMDGVPDGAAIQTTTTTGTDGLYLFDGLHPGSYIVGVTPPAPVSGPAYLSTTGAGEETSPNTDGDNNDNGITLVGSETRSDFVTLAPGTEPTSETPNNDATKPDSNSNLTVDFGFYQPLTIAGNVYNDQNGPTNVDGTPIGTASGTQLYANLIDPNGNVLAVDSINSNGTYEFTDVLPNTIYTIILTDLPGVLSSPAPANSLPAGWANVSEDCCDNFGNDGTTNGLITASLGTSDLTNANFGIRELLALGNYIWVDSNKNGVIDNNETPLSGAVVKLYEDFNGDNTPDGAAVATMTTTASGLYKFEGLEAAKYVVGVTPPIVTGATLMSSITGEESDPNLNIDSNDNGVTLIGTEIRTNFIDLAPNMEPIGELPNNTPTVSDSNSNLTVDFGFFVCPAGFNFADYALCVNDTVDLTAYEPTGYTGGSWTLNNVVVANPMTVGTPGVYTYTYTEGDCTTSGTMEVKSNVPDYTPTIVITPNAVIGSTSVRVVITINEIDTAAACSDVYILVPKLLPRYQFTWQPTATTITLANYATIPVSNADWQFFANANPNFYIWKYQGTGGIFPSLGNSTFGYVGLYDPNNTDGQSTFSVQIFQGSGGETDQTNNTDSDLLTYFR